jgi:ubiquitin carboxyl-terminal hydrolase 4/11
MHVLLFVQFPTVDDNTDGHRSTTDSPLLTPKHEIIYLPSSQTSDRGGDDWSMNQSEVTDNHENETSVRTMKRRYGSGLGNLGNTCFMNSTLQCLAHTEPLQRYFLTGAYVADLNRDNPLGTGGELATQFAKLLAEMWCSKQVLRNGLATDSSSTWYTSATNVVYPRSFKITLGKHAEQFMGYDQHDSQELATYLLDALHEDCNRVTNKPYIEKPEQTQDETDQEASDKAWDLHLKREDSRVLENFMGQVKSRVQCCQPECGRISTTFDPFMFLSVPIPGTEDRSISFTFVPLDPNMRAKKLSIIVNKMSNIEEMVKKTVDLLPTVEDVSDAYAGPGVEDLIVCDVWKNEILTFLTHDSEVEKIRDNDDIFVYQVRPVDQVRTMEEKINESKPTDDSEVSKMMETRDTKRLKRYKLNVETLTRLNKGNAWVNELQRYMKNPTACLRAFSTRRPDSEDGAKIYRHILMFLQQCHSAVENGEDTAGQKRTRSDTVEDDGDAVESSSAAVDPIASATAVQEISERCDMSIWFKDVSSKHDLAVLEFLASKIFQEIVQHERQKSSSFPDGVLVEIRIRGNHSKAGAPFLLRIPRNMTVYGLREELALRLSRSLKTAILGETPSRSSDVTNHSMGSDSNTFGGPALWVLRALPLSYQRKGYGVRSYDTPSQMGSIARPTTSSYYGYGSYHTDVRNRSPEFALPDHAEEKEIVADLVGDKGHVFLDLSEEVFDFLEYGTVDEPYQPGSPSKNAITVLDCIEKFCQMEQLEESEQWYCSQCKAHVRAWKQFHIYRSPPHLIVHLKRFQFSARTHRRQKIGVYVDFPLEGLDLSKQVLHWTDDEKPIYDCYAVSNHYGGLGGGHYTAYALNDGGVWCHYDDSRISSNVDPSEVVSQAAYVLYYRRRDVPVGQDFEFTVSTPEPIVRPPMIIQDAPGLAMVASNGNKLNREPSEISSNAAMIDDDEAMEDTTDIASRSTSPASVSQEYTTNKYGYGRFRSVDDDEGDSSERSSGNKTPSSLPLQ